jgi:uncharacterized protein (TIGR01244 family)
VYNEFEMLDIVNFMLVRPNLATSGQPEPEDFAAIHAAGYQLIINLVPPESGDYLPEEPQIAASHGLEYLAIPVVWDAPTRDDLQQYFDALDDNRARPVWAHCVVNYRVSAFTFLYRVLREGVPLETALTAMLAIWEPNPTWQRFIDERLMG